jgi:hypothetical protein
VDIDVPLRLTGAAPERRIDGLAEPAQGGALITLASAAQGAWQWGTAQASGTALSLVLDPPITGYRDGLLVRFLAPATLQGPMTLDVDGQGALPILRPDGLDPVAGQLITGVVCEVMQANGRFILLSAAEHGCPPASIQVNARFCIDHDSVNNQQYYTAMSHCANRGGRLCTWDEYHAACALLGAQLAGMFNQWEWIDDTSNHTQTVDQAGRATCQSQRSAGNPLSILGDTRCCYHPR